jgi:hypothetical protein
MSLHPKFKLKGQEFPAEGILAIVPREDGVEIRWAQRAPVIIKGITTQEVMAKVDEAKAQHR